MTDHDFTAPHDFTALPDLASRRLGGGVVHATDELFAERENLIAPHPAEFSATAFGHKGKTYDGWETRRRRGPGHDWAIVRLGAPGVVRGVVVDTAWFTGNYPPHASVEATGVEGYPSPEELDDAEWDTLVERTDLRGDRAHRFEVRSSRRYTHVRLSIYPDGGVARFRVHGEAVPDPRLLGASADLVALENGGAVVECSNMFYSSPLNLILPDRARTMGEGWENARRRTPGNEHVEFRLAAPGIPAMVELDTTWFVGNAPAEIALSARDDRSGGPEKWVALLPRTRVQPDTPHRFPLSFATEVTHMRMDVYPDGGLSRVRLHGTLTPAARGGLALRWFNSLPDRQARQVLSGAGITGAEAERLVTARPLTDPAGLPGTKP